MASMTKELSLDVGFRYVGVVGETAIPPLI